MGDLRLRGQEMQIRISNGGTVVQEVSSNIGSFNDSLDLAISEDSFLGEVANRFDSILNGYSGDFEFQVNKATWENFKLAVTQKAQRINPALVFNIISTDFYANGGNVVRVFEDVSFGPIGRSGQGRADFVKMKSTFKCSDVAVQINSF